ncbi:MAG: indolepyruvate ferredoxin oxidoreductase [Deltaproteobacteria bacterium]|nr:indolepyruvate ferredoxin oxidoreductase [Deltaproteobacteria bacterium]
MARDEVTGPQVLLGDEAVALAAVHAGITTAYAYPGTPSTEIVEYLVRYEKKHGNPRAIWATNEKTAYEQALGTSMVGRRTLVAMKHVGLNVAADPFMNSAILDIAGGVVVAVADDPGMHSSQNEQDTRYFADFARVLCFEPTNQQEAYEMTLEAFELSERFKIPVVIRLVTRLAHSRAVVEARPGVDEKPLKKPADPSTWTLLPANARKQWRELLEIQKDLVAYSEATPFNSLSINEDNKELGVITCGIARNYFRENLADMESKPSTLHIGAYPFPVEKVRALGAHVKRIVVLEDGYPFVERTLRGVFPMDVEICGRESGHLPPDGELNPELVRTALGLPAREKGAQIEAFELPGRPPQLCQGCGHGDTYKALNNVVKTAVQSIVTADIGCYTLGALPPYNAVESCVCMGASVSMAKGAADAGFHPAFGVIGDSTFLHSGVTPLMDAVANNASMTLLIVDNSTVAMTGGQPTILPEGRIEDIVLGVGVPREHVRRMRSHPRDVDKIEAALREEMDYRGVSVLILQRECLESLKKNKKSKKSKAKK